jgi:hypothetical protein
MLFFMEKEHVSPKRRRNNETATTRDIDMMFLAGVVVVNDDGFSDG